MSIRGSGGGVVLSEPRPPGGRRIAQLFVGLLLLTALGSAGRVTAKAGPPVPMGVTGNWELMLSDEFEEAVLDHRTWSTQFRWGTTSTTTPRATYRPENVLLIGDDLVLRAKREPHQGRPFTSGMVTSADVVGRPTKFAFRYGYVEVRAKMPTDPGLWPAFWMLPVSGAWPPEIDVLENTTGHPRLIGMHYHYLDEVGEKGWSGGTWTGPDFTAAYHVFSVEWAPGVIRWRVDGVQRRAAFTSARDVVDTPMYLLATLQVPHNGPKAGVTGKVDGSGRTSSDFAIDYVRVWRRG
jgi:beta-glucanase (GH16 family)